MKLKEKNNADQRLVVGELEVIGSVSGSNIRTLKRTVDTLSNSVSIMGTQVNEYWKEASSDSVITASEKKILKKEYEQIETVYYSMDDLADQRGLKQTAQWISFKNAYLSLKSYLFDELHLFSNMATSTKVNTTVFNDKYSTYYDNQLLMQTILSEGEAQIRILSNLAENGTPGEIAVYKNSMYQYNDGKWTRFSTPGYLGALEEIPQATVDDYFLCLSEMTWKPLLMIQRKNLSVGGKLLKLNAVTMEEGYIYYFDGNWKKVTDKNDWRYVVALNDLLENGYEVSPYISTYIKSEVDTKIETETAKFTPHYLGPFETIAALIDNGWHEGDWFCWSNNSTVVWDYSEEQDPITLETGNVYKYNKPTWTKLDPANTKYFSENMAALKDITAAKKSENGFFNAVLANTILATEAFISELGAKIITLKNGGKFKSENFDEDNEDETPGLLFDTDGNAHLHGDTHIKGNLDVGGNAVLTGEFKSSNYQKFVRGWRLPRANEGNIPAEFYFLYTRGISNWAKTSENKSEPVELNEHIQTGRIHTTGFFTATNNAVEITQNCETLYNTVLNWVLADSVEWGSAIWNIPCRGTLSINEGSSTRYLRPFWIFIDETNERICFDCEYSGNKVSLQVAKNGTVWWNGKASGSGVYHFVSTYLRLGF